MSDTRDDSLLHSLWSKAVGTPDYDKREWMALEAKLTSVEKYQAALERVYEIDKAYCEHGAYSESCVTCIAAKALGYT